MSISLLITNYIIPPGDKSKIKNQLVVFNGKHTGKEILLSKLNAARHVRQFNY